MYPSVVEYDLGYRARAVVELQTLPGGSVVDEMLGDYAAMRRLSSYTVPQD